MRKLKCKYDLALRHDVEARILDRTTLEAKWGWFHNLNVGIGFLCGFTDMDEAKKVLLEKLKPDA